GLDVLRAQCEIQRRAFFCKSAARWVSQPTICSLTIWKKHNEGVLSDTHRLFGGGVDNARVVIATRTIYVQQVLKNIDVVPSLEGMTAKD
ncbi:hypothetical protein, partial [Acinetobacter vivianii]|uniref:hypothetical protein n=1 Tax=Acinetobacter vivianii TaxID=1776742 RepID=UPI003CFCC951